MSFLKRLFGGGAPDSTQAKVAAESTHKGCTIKAMPQPEGGQFRLQGVIEKDMDGTTKTHKLIRADLFSSVEDATDATIRKARQLIDEQGDRIFD